MGRLIDANSVYNAIQITTDNFGVAKHVVETNMFDMLAKIPTVEAIPKDQYEAILKANMVAMLTEIQLEIEELYPKARKTYRDGLTSYCEGVDDSCEIIQEKINSLKEQTDGNDI